MKLERLKSLQAQEIQKVVLRETARSYGVNEKDVKPESRFKEDLQTVESSSKIFFFSFLIEMEEIFSIILPDDESRSIEVVNDLTVSICKQKNVSF